MSLLFQPKCALELREGISAIQDFFLSEEWDKDTYYSDNTIITSLKFNVTLSIFYLKDIQCLKYVEPITLKPKYHNF